MEDDTPASVRSLPERRHGPLPQRLRPAPLTRREPSSARRKPAQHPRQHSPVHLTGVTDACRVPAQRVRRQDANVQQICEVCSTCWLLVRVTLVIGFSFLPQTFGRWWGHEFSFCSKMNGASVVLTTTRWQKIYALAGGGMQKLSDFP